MPEAKQFISAGEVRELLRSVYAAEREGKLLDDIARALRDPATPFDARGRSRPHPLWLSLLLLVLLGAACLVLFTVLER